RTAGPARSASIRPGRRSIARRGALCAWLAACAGPALAWGNHALSTWPALNGMPELARLAPVRVESLEAFVSAEAESLARLLDEQEAWARRNVPDYPWRPDALRFKIGRAHV